MKINHDLLDKIYITSDTHAFHVNITRGTSNWGNTGEFRFRDFDHWKEMTEQMVDNFNSVIPKDGILFHLGDWSFNGRDKIELFRSMLNLENVYLPSEFRDCLNNVTKIRVLESAIKFSDDGNIYLTAHY